MNYKQIPQYPAYEVSKCGTSVRVIGMDNSIKQSIQKVKGKETGYYYCTLLRDYNGTMLPLPKRIAVHRLVAFAWLDEPTEGKVWINHKDGNKANNHRDNIEWTTISENIQHAFDTGLHKVYKGADHWNYGKTVKLDTKKKMSEAKQGTRHPKFKGYYFVNFKRYPSANSASIELNIPAKTILNRCKSDKWRLKGWYFLPI